MLGVCLRCEFVQSCSREYGSSTNMVERARFLNGYSMDLERNPKEFRTDLEGILNGFGMDVERILNES